MALGLPALTLGLVLAQERLASLSPKAVQSRISPGVRSRCVLREQMIRAYSLSTEYQLRYMALLLLCMGLGVWVVRSSMSRPQGGFAVAGGGEGVGGHVMTLPMTNLDNMGGAPRLEPTHSWAAAAAGQGGVAPPMGVMPPSTTAIPGGGSYTMPVAGTMMPVHSLLS